VGFSWTHTQAHFFRAALESVAYEYAYYLRILTDLLPELRLTEARAIGGGARSPIWNQIKADVLGVPYQRLEGNEFGTWGCALIAGKAAGLFDDLAARAAEAAQPAAAPIQPAADRRALYDPLIERYIALQSNLNRFFTQEGSS
jgi:xylulokinase